LVRIMLDYSNTLLMFSWFVFERLVISRDNLTISRSSSYILSNTILLIKARTGVGSDANLSSFLIS
jgi:hypothetical protein